MRDRVRPLRLSKIGLPSICSLFSRSATVEVGRVWRRTAKAPATWGVAIDVPLKLANPPPGTDEVMLEPGAQRSSTLPEFEKVEIWSALVVEPTVTAVLMHPGEVTPAPDPLFPAAIAVGVPAESRLSIAGLSGLLSHAPPGEPPPRLMFTEAMLKLSLSVSTRSSPLIWSLSYASAHGSSPAPLQFEPVKREKTSMEISLASRAIPLKVSPLPAAIPAT